MKKVLKYVVIILFIGMVIIQFIARPEKLDEPFNPQNDMIALLGVTGELKNILHNTCYDCHSNQPTYPWYSGIAPVSWWMEGHINHGREELNFSDWGTYSKRRRDHKLDEMVEEVEAGKMPLPSYTWAHWGSKLNEEELTLLKSWVEKEREKIAQEN